MKYFTPELWISFQTPQWERASKHWQRRFEAYKKELARILPKMNSSGRAFFRDALVLHDGTLTRLEVGDRIADPTGTGRHGGIARRLEVCPSVISDRVPQRCYLLRYKGVSRIDLSLPGQVTLFPSGEYPNFGDWGYDELSLRRPGVFRHEILFASGATIATEFKQFSFRRTPLAKQMAR
jgi:hypothetical protein